MTKRHCGESLHITDTAKQPEWRMKMRLHKCCPKEIILWGHKTNHGPFRTRNLNVRWWKKTWGISVPRFCVEAFQECSFLVNFILMLHRLCDIFTLHYYTLFLYNIYKYIIYINPFQGKRLLHTSYAFPAPSYLYATAPPKSAAWSPSPLPVPFRPFRLNSALAHQKGSLGRGPCGLGAPYSIC